MAIEIRALFHTMKYISILPLNISVLKWKKLLLSVSLSICQYCRGDSGNNAWPIPSKAQYLQQIN